ncbi:hypothetical protein ACWEG1_05975 [Streptomyces bauhiniae]
MSEPTGHTPGTHDANNCRLCAMFKHPAQAKAGRALAQHLLRNPLPVQKTGEQR